MATHTRRRPQTDARSQGQGNHGGLLTGSDPSPEINTGRFINERRVLASGQHSIVTEVEPTDSERVASPGSHSSRAQTPLFETPQKALARHGLQSPRYATLLRICRDLLRLHNVLLSSHF